MRLHPLASHTESHLFLNSQSCWKRYHIYQEKLCHSCFFTLIIVLLIISGGSDVNNLIIPIILIPVYTPKWKCLGEADPDARRKPLPSLTASRRLKVGERTWQPRRVRRSEGRCSLSLVRGISFAFQGEMSIFSKGNVSFLIFVLFSFTENNDAHAFVRVYAVMHTLEYMHIYAY